MCARVGDVLYAVCCRLLENIKCITIRELCESPSLARNLGNIWRCIYIYPIKLLKLYMMEL